MRGIEWAAGLIEGEGCIWQQRAGYWCIEATSSDRDVLDELHRILGCGKVGVVPRSKKPHWKVTYRWRLHSQDDVRAVLRRIRPYLLERRAARADRALAAIG